MSYKKIDKKLIQLQKQYRKTQQKCKDDLLLYFDEFNVIKQDKKRMYRRYKRYRSANDLVNLYFLYLLSLPETDDILLELGILEIIDGMYEDYSRINKKEFSEFKNIGYETCLTDIDKTSSKKQFRVKEDKQYIGKEIIRNTSRIKQIAHNEIQRNTEKHDTTILDKMANEWLKINENKFSGYVERMAELEYNQGYIQACKDNNIKQVQFIAIRDNKTTDMCESLDLQVFNVTGKNKFYRYYDSVKTNKYTEVDGLVQGINMPPIDDHFHWCRSYLQALNYKTNFLRSRIKGIHKNVIETLKIVQEEFEKIPKNVQERLEREGVTIIFDNNAKTSGYDWKNKQIIIKDDLEKGEFTHEIGHALYYILNVSNYKIYNQLVDNIISNGTIKEFHDKQVVYYGIETTYNIDSNFQTYLGLNTQEALNNFNNKNLIELVSEAYRAYYYEKSQDILLRELIEEIEKNA